MVRNLRFTAMYLYLSKMMITEMSSRCQSSFNNHVSPCQKKSNVVIIEGE